MFEQVKAFLVEGTRNADTVLAMVVNARRMGDTFMMTNVYNLIERRMKSN